MIYRRFTCLFSVSWNIQNTRYSRYTRSNYHKKINCFFFFFLYIFNNGFYKIKFKKYYYYNRYFISIYWRRDQH